MAIRKLTTSSITNNVWYKSMLAGNSLLGRHFGYACNVSQGVSASMNKFSFADDSRTLVSMTASTFTNGSTGSFSSLSAGYAFGGFNGSNPQSTGFKMILSTETSSTLATGLSTTRDTLAGFESETHGYAAGGGVGGAGGGNITIVDKFDFSDDSRTTLATGISTNAYGVSGFRSTTFGYVAGGFGDSTFKNFVDKFNFSNDARTSLGAILSVGGYGTGAMESADAGYVAGGRNSGTRTNRIDKIAFATDTRTTLGTGLPTAGEHPMGFASTNFGYLAGIFDGSSWLSGVQKLDFTNDTHSSLATGLAIAQSFGGAFEG